MFNYAVIENGIVVNAVVSDPDYAAKHGWILLPNAAGIGWKYINGEFENPNLNGNSGESNQFVPQVVGSGQIRAAMIANGYAQSDDELSTLIENILSTISDQVQRSIAITLWRNASEFRRDHQFIAVVQSALGKSDADIDELFRLAITF